MWKCFRFTVDTVFLAGLGPLGAMDSLAAMDMGMAILHLGMDLAAMAVSAAMVVMAVMVSHMATTIMDIMGIMGVKRKRKKSQLFEGDKVPALSSTT